MSNIENLTNSKISYSELSIIFSDHLKKTGKPNQVIKNARSAINSWCNALDLNQTDRIGNEFSKSFSYRIGKYAQTQATRDKKKSTCSSRVSLIKSVQRFYVNYTKNRDLPNQFGERLKFLLKLYGYSATGFWKLHLSTFINNDNFLKWIKCETSPSSRNLYIVELLENILKIRRGTLLECVKNRSKRRFINSSSKTKNIVVSRPSNPAYELEFQDLVKFKTSVVPPFGMNRRKRSIWTGESGQIPPSAKICKAMIGRYLGFLCLGTDDPNPALHGYCVRPEDVSLAHLVDAEKLEKYLTTFWEAGTGIYHNGAIVFIQFVTGLLRKDTGYIYQKTDLATKIGMKADPKAWQKKCLEARDVLIKIREHIINGRESGGENFGFGRDPQKKILHILQSSNPLAITIKMTKDMQQDAEKLAQDSLKKVILLRDTLLIAMLQANPLRVKMFSIMRFGKNLVRKSDGSWWLMFKRQDFKNRQFLNSDYQVRVASELWKMIDEYKNHHRPQLFKSAETDFVFLPSAPSYNKKRCDFGIHETGLSIIVTERTRQYMPNCEGFGPHSFRHIIATHIIKTKGGFGFFLAAKVLHDSLETVETNYAHLKTSEMFEPYNDLFAGSWNSPIHSNKNVATDDPNEKGGEDADEN